MRALVAGCGSIGFRRARLLAEMGHEAWILDPRADLVPADMRLVEWDIHREGIGLLVQDGFDERCWYDPGIPDAAFVCTPAHTHVEVANQCVEAGIKGLFVEKPLSVSMDGIPELIAECDKRGVVTMGACNMRWAYPEWRDTPMPNRAHTLFKSHSPLSTWGGVGYTDAGLALESAVHELDLALCLRGPVADMEAAGDEESMLIYLVHERGGTSTISVDWSEDAERVRKIVVGLPLARECEADTSDEMYRQEMAHFLECVEHNKPTCNPLSGAAETLRWALKARDMTTVVA